MIENQTHSYICFSNNVTRSFINKYNTECDVMTVMYVILLTHKFTIIIIISVKYIM